MAATKRAYRSLGYEVVCRIPDFYAPSDDKLILVNKVHGIYNCTVACFVTLEAKEGLDIQVIKNIQPYMKPDTVNIGN